MNSLAKRINKILIARTENRIGDIVLTLLLTGILKSHLPHIRIVYLGSGYADPIIKKTSSVDEFHNWNIYKDLSGYNADAIMLLSPGLEIAKAAWRAKIPIRIGTARRWHHWLYATHWVLLKHRPSYLHEIQIMTPFLKALGIKEPTSIDCLHCYYGWQKQHNQLYPGVISDTKRNIILHPKSRGSAPEWPLEHYCQLAHLLKAKNYNVILSGTEKEKRYIHQYYPDLFAVPDITNTIGQYDHDLMSFCNLVEQADCLVASSTGPVHLAAAAGIHTISLYAPVRPQHPERWKPIGKRVQVLCKGTSTNNKKDIDKINAIMPEEVLETIEQMLC